jgi:GNAT superfamily N-acetyltransferase
MPEIRPMRAGDVLESVELAMVCFEDYARRRGEPLDARPDINVSAIRYHRCLDSDPGGSWVAEHDGRIVACALAILREGVWGLSLLVVHPDHQSAGLGREILARAHDYAAGARGRIILSSSDPRAVRAYLKLGLAPHPCLQGRGAPRRVTPADGVRQGGPEDIPFTEAVDRHVRGAAHGEDIATFLEMGALLLVAPGRGYAVLRGDGGTVRLLAAYEEEAARELLRTALARAEGRDTRVECMSARQRWAIDVCLEAGLELTTDSGAVFLGGDVGPFAPYLPSGAFL